MKFLLQNNGIGLYITRLAVMFKVFLNHFICYVASTPSTLTNCPEMSAPVSFRKRRVFFLKPSGCSTFQTFYNIAYVQRWSIFDMDMYMILANYSFQNPYIFRITNLLNKLSTAFLNISFQHFIPITW